MDLPGQKKPTIREPFIRIPAPVEGEEGLGDVIKKMTSKIGFKPCSGCQKRATMLNRWVSFTPMKK